MGHRHDEDSKANEVRHLENPYCDWNEAANAVLLARIEAEHPLEDSIEEENENDTLPTSQIYDFNNPESSESPQRDVDMPTETLLGQQPKSLPNTSKCYDFAVTADGKFDHVFERRLMDQLNILLCNHVKSEQIDCNDRSMYTGLPGITLLFNNLTGKACLDSKLRDKLASIASSHVNQYLTIIQTQHMHNSKCPSYLCGELGIVTFCALAKAQQKLHREMLTRTLSYPGPGQSLSQSAPTTPNVLNSDQRPNHHDHLLHLQHQHQQKHQLLAFAGPIMTSLEPDTNLLLDKVLELVKLQEQPGTPDELLYGRTGGLYAMLLIKQQLPRQTVIKDEHISSHIELMLKSGKSMESFGRPLFYSWHGKEYVGAAHGYAGILFMLLEASKHLNQDQLDLIKQAVDFVEGIRYPSCNFPSSIGSQTDRLVHWCHGAPGVVHLLIKAHQVYGDSKYLESALACGDVIWQRGLLKKGFSICHGISGNAYAFLHLYQHTRDLRHLYRAGKFAQFYMEHGNLISWRADSPASLFEGYAGLAYFLADLLSPSEARFPAFQLSC